MTTALTVICLTAFFAAILTFFSGFGLGTLLSPVFMIFFPVDVSIALTGIVHFFNNLFKLTLVGKNADKRVLLKFGVPAILASLLGAWMLLRLSDLTPLFSYAIKNRIMVVYPMKFVIALLLLFFSAMDLIPALSNLRFSKDKLIIGGALSGFFGGLSGNQGALRSAFLIKSGLTKEAYLGTAVVVSCFVDFTRLGVYSSHFFEKGLSVHYPLIICATLSAMTGAYLGNRLFKKVTLRFIQLTVAVLLLVIALGLGSGLL